MDKKQQPVDGGGSVSGVYGGQYSIENIMLEIEKSNTQISEVIRLQNELSQSENDLLALQIRFVHK